jgi:hypothetical protein
MSITAYRAAGGLITLRTGQEGPHHDPYGFTEVKVVRNGHKVIFHQGLGEWLSVDGVMQRQKHKKLRKEYAFEDEESFRLRRFKEATGWELPTVILAIQRADDRRRRNVDYADIQAAERAAGWDPNP